MVRLHTKVKKLKKQIYIENPDELQAIIGPYEHLMYVAELMEHEPASDLDSTDKDTYWKRPNMFNDTSGIETRLTWQTLTSVLERIIISIEQRKNHIM